MDMSSEISDFLRKQGVPIHMHTPFCEQWKATHEGCVGCESELGCHKLVALMAVLMTPMVYTPRDYADWEAMQKGMAEKKRQILAATTAEEVSAISLP